MKTKVKEQKSIMEQLREIRDKLSAEMRGMTPEQMKEFINNHATFHSKKFWDNPKIIKR